MGLPSFLIAREGAWSASSASDMHRHSMGCTSKKGEVLAPKLMQVQITCSKQGTAIACVVLNSIAMFFDSAFRGIMMSAQKAVGV